MTGRSGLTRGTAIVLAAGLAALALALVLGAMAVAAPLGFLHIRSNLSRTPALVSAYPDLAVSPDGKWVAAAWVEGYRSIGQVYLRVASETGSGWGTIIPVFTGTVSACAYDAAMAITGTTVHVAYVVFSNTCDSPKETSVRYRTCPLDTGQCSSPEASVVITKGSKITWVDLALDAAENPHVVWSQRNLLAMKDEIYYRRLITGTTWGNVEAVGSPINDNTAPAIAWADGYVHVVWQEQVGQGNDAQRGIMYQRRAGSGWGGIIPICRRQAELLPGNPDVVAGAGQVFVVWDWCSEYETLPSKFCERYQLVYRRSTDNGAHWGYSAYEIREVGTDKYYYSQVLTQYASVSVESPAARDEYLLDLQPSIALNRRGLPAVVWHVDRSGGAGTDYVIYHSYASTATGSAVSWITPTVLSLGQRITTGAAVIGIGEPQPGGQQHLHVAYMQKLSTSNWDVFYDSNERDRYRYIHLPIIMRAH